MARSPSPESEPALVGATVHVPDQSREVSLRNGGSEQAAQDVVFRCGNASSWQFGSQIQSQRAPRLSLGSTAVILSFRGRPSSACCACPTALSFCSARMPRKVHTLRPSPLVPQIGCLLVTPPMPSAKLHPSRSERVWRSTSSRPEQVLRNIHSRYHWPQSQERPPRDWATLGCRSLLREGLAESA